MSSGITITGLASGLDTSSIISKLMAVERLPEQALQANAQADQAQSAAYTQLQASVTNLQTVMRGMSTAATFKGMLSTVSDSSALTVTTSSAASAGSHTLQVLNLAQSQRQVSTGYADGALFNTGSFTIDNGSGTVTSINLAEGSNTLAGIAAAINGSGANVTASIINDGSSTPNRLVITGNDTANYAADFSGLTTPPATGVASAQAPTLLGSADASYQTGKPASFVLDGVAMSKNSNSVTDALQGVTLNLLKGGATSTINIANDTASATDNVNKFVTAYNSVMALINTDTSYDSTTNKAGVLLGDSAVRTIQSQMQSMLIATVSGVGGPYSSLADLGISSDKSDGTLTVDSTQLSTALSNNYNGVVDLFTHNTGSFANYATNQYGLAQQFNLSLDSIVHPYVGDSYSGNGLLSTRIHDLATSITDINNQVSEMELLISAKQANLQNQFSNMESLVSSLQAQGAALTSWAGGNSSGSSSSSSSLS